MKVCIINGSPRSSKSSTLKLTKLFVKGMGEKAKEIDTFKSFILPCKGCYKCWQKNSRKCVINDDVPKIIDAIKKSDVVIWSTPLFCYSIPSTLKALLDRMTFLSRPTIIVNEDGSETHPTIDVNTKHILISASPLTNRDNGFDAVKFQFTHMFGKDIPMILCTEKNVLKANGTQMVTEEYLKAVEQAGKDFKEFGHISLETQEKLDRQMIPPELYIDSVNFKI